MIKPFAGLKVVDLSRLLAGPYATQMLADFGADVIKIEPPAGDDARHLGPPFIDGDGIFFKAANGGKRSIAIDLARDEGRELVLGLAAEADVFVENFRPGMADKLGVGYEAVRARSPRVVYCSISGFGATGPMQDRGGVDTIFQAMGGLIAAIDAEGGAPIKVASPIADIAAGQMAAFAISAALTERSRTGEGTHVQVAIRDALAALLTPVVTYALLTGENPPRWGNASQFAAPADIFRTADGHLALSVINDKHWRRLCEAMEVPELADDERFATPKARLANRDALTANVQATLSQRSTAQWEERLNAQGVPAGPIMGLTDVARDEQLAANGLIIGTPGGPAVGLPLRFGDEPLTTRGGVPRCGEHTASILVDHGYSAEAIAALVDSGTVKA